MPFTLTRSVAAMAQESPQMRDAIDAILAQDAAFDWFAVWDDRPDAERFPETFDTPEGPLFLSWNYGWEYGYMGIGSYLMTEAEHAELDRMLKEIDNELGLGHFNETQDMFAQSAPMDPFNDFDLSFRPNLCENIDMYYDQAVSAVEDMFRQKFVD